MMRNSGNAAGLSRRDVLVGSLAIAVNGCDMPHDARGTLQRVMSEGRLHVGLSENPPWVVLNGEAVDGIEPALLRIWAEKLRANLSWYRGAETELFQALEKGALDLVVAGLVTDNPWSDRSGMTRPYFAASLRFGIPSESPEPTDWRGQPVTVPPGRMRLRALVQDEDAVPVSGGAKAAAVAAYDFELRALGLRITGPVLATEKHVIATAAGESAFLLALDRFLAGLDGPAMRRLVERRVPL
jgi:ABC-type amino acid transport substrate-binding protein